MHRLLRRDKIRYRRPVRPPAPIHYGIGRNRETCHRGQAAVGTV